MPHSSSGAPLDPVAFIHSQIRTVPDWPQPGVMFRDITTLLQSEGAAHPRRPVRRALCRCEARLRRGLDARGFIIAPIVAYELSVGFVPIRKVGKLPYKTRSESYDLEYGSATVEIHEDACRPGDRVIIMDDLIATGGTMMAGRNLLQRLGAEVVEGAAIIDLPDLGGSALLRNAGLPVYTVTEFAGH